jgi:hypothetical protein
VWTATLAKIKLKVLMSAIDDALKRPSCARSEIEANNLTLMERVSGGIDASLDLAEVIGRGHADDALLKCLGKKLRSQKFARTHKAWNCVGGILIVPNACVSSVSPALVHRISEWTPNSAQLEDILTEPTSVPNPTSTEERMEENVSEGQAERREKVNSPKRMEVEWQKMFLVKRGADLIATAGEKVHVLLGNEQTEPRCGYLEAVSAQASTGSTVAPKYVATNAITTNECEWAVQVDDSGGQHTFIIQLEQCACVLGISLRLGT